MRTTQDGYLTLSSLNPDGNVDVFGRNIFVRAGRTTLIPGLDSRVAYQVGGPSGLNRVRASFTPRETDTGRVTYRGRNGQDIWTQTIESDISDYSVRDVAQTSFLRSLNRYPQVKGVLHTHDMAFTVSTSITLRPLCFIIQKRHWQWVTLPRVTFVYTELS